MFGNWIQATTATTGTGNLTISAVSGYPQPSDAFALNQPFSYVLLDSNSKPLEAGIAYLSASNTVVRAKVTATYSGGTYTDENATAANLTGATTLICTPHAATLPAALLNVDTVSAGISRYILAANRNANIAATAPTANRMYYVPFRLDAGVVVTSLALNVGTAGAAGTKARVAIYNCLSSGYPGSILVGNNGDLAMDSTGVKTETLPTSMFLSPGWYYTAACVTGGTIVCYSASGGNFTGQNPLGFSGTTAIEYRYETLAGGWTSLPTTASTTTTAATAGNSAQPAVFVGVQ